MIILLLIAWPITGLALALIIGRTIKNRDING